jgi:periplasmic protein TonB
MAEPRRYQWGLALLFAVVAHVAIATLVRSPAPVAVGEPGIRIALGSAGSAGGDGAEPEAKTGAPVIKSSDAADRIETLAPVAERIQAIEPALPEPVTAVAVEEPLQPTTKAEAVQSREPPPPQRSARVAPKPQAQPQPAKPQLAKPQPPAPKAASNAADTGTPSGDSRANPGGTTSAAGQGGGGQTSGSAQGGKSRDRYYAELAAWLERHKRYPQRARQLRQEGVARVRFVIDRSGKVISHRIEKSSGHSALDEAASELLRRASPMPAIPPSIGQSRLEIVVPIAYRLR